MLDARERFGNFVDGRRIGAADMAFAACTERTARHERDVLGFEQRLGEFFVGVARARDVGEDVERAFRLEAFEAHLREALVDQAAAAVVFGDHLLHIFFAVAQRLDGGHLRRDGRA